MRIAVISHTYVVGSNRGKLEELTKSDGLQLLLVVPKRWTNRDVGHGLRADMQQGSLCQVVIAGVWPVGFGSLALYSPVALFRFLRAFRPNVVYVEEEPWSLAALELSCFSSILGARLIFFTWDNLGPPLSLPQQLVRRLVLRLADGAVAGNQEARLLLLESRFDKPISVIPQLGIDPSLFFATQSATLVREFVVGYVGRLVDQKGVMHYLEAVARVQGARALVVGRGPLEPQLIRRARSLGLDGRYELCSGVAHNEVPTYLRRMDVLVLPSVTTARWKEQFGHVLIEAMACGVPVVGSDSGAIPEVIGDAGMVFKEGDIDELTAILQRLKEHPSLRATLRTRGLARVEQEFTNQVLARKLHEFLLGV